MVWTLLALALWVVLGGFISYYGDLQGRRWGKRRVSWFGMRPKHTAILITSLTGGFIALFSVLSLMIIVPTVRDVVLRGENAIQENKRLNAAEQNQRVQDTLRRDRENRASQLKQDANDARLAEGQRELKDVHYQLQDAITRRAQLQDRLNKLADKVLQLNAKVTGLQSQAARYAVLIPRLEHQTENAGNINLALGTQNAALSHQNDTLDKSNVALAASNKTLEEKNARLTLIGKQFSESNDLFYRDGLRLQKEKLALQDQVADLTHERDEVLDLIRQRDQLNGTLQRLSRQIADKNYDLRTGYVTLRAGVELGRLNVEAHLRPDAIKKAVSLLLTSASDKAKSLGAAPDEDGHAARLLAQKKVTLTGYEDRDENAQVDALAESWSGQDVSFVVVATTVTNCLAGEAAYIDLRRYPVIRVFTKGDEVASRTIDGRSSVEDIISNLMAFLQKDVKDSALRAGTIPRVDPETGATEVGVLGTADLFRLTDRVRRIHGPVVLSARAKQDLSSADRLNLTFHVSRQRAPAQNVAVE